MSCNVASRLHDYDYWQLMMSSDVDSCTGFHRGNVNEACMHDQDDKAYGGIADQLR